MSFEEDTFGRTRLRKIGIIIEAEVDSRITDDQLEDLCILLEDDVKDDLGAGRVQWVAAEIESNEEV